MANGPHPTLNLQHWKNNHQSMRVSFPVLNIAGTDAMILTCTSSDVAVELFPCFIYQPSRIFLASRRTLMLEGSSYASSVMSRFSCKQKNYRYLIFHFIEMII
jgi:hypothetical protein